MSERNEQIDAISKNEKTKGVFMNVKLSMVIAFILSLSFQANLYAEVKTEKAILAAGCFWGVEESFRKIPGVIKTQVGYTGGKTSHPKYEDMHDGKTGHAESVEIIFDPTKVSFNELMNHFYKMHDPTTLNRQGNDVGSQYRSAIFYTSDAQKKLAQEFKIKVDKSKAWKSPVVTEILEASVFWPAEEYHQKYLIKNPGGYDNHYMRNISFEAKEKLKK